MRWQHWWFAAPLRVRSIFRRTQADQELEEELRFHLERKIEEEIGRGLSPQEARYAAMRALDGWEQQKEEMRDMRHVHWLTDFIDDSRYAIRSILRTPGFSAFVVLTLALGIGTTAAVFSLGDALMLRPIPVPDPGKVVELTGAERDNPTAGFSYREYLDLRNEARSYEGMAAFKDMEEFGFSSQPAAIARVKGGMMVSANFFDVLHVQPQAGRVFRPDEEKVAGQNAVMVLGANFWKQEFAGNAAVTGRHVLLNGVDFTIIGVAPRSFTGTDNYVHPDFYIPLAMAPRLATTDGPNLLEDRSDREIHVWGRLKPHATLQQARAEISVLAKNFQREYPKTNRNRGAAVYTMLELRRLYDSIDAGIALMLGVLSLAVLLVSCTNVAGILLSRARTRTREIAVRLAIGAGRFRLIRLLFTENLMITLLGGLLGIGLGFAGVEFIGRYKIPSELPLILTVRMDRRALLVSLAVTVLSSLLCGLAPALQSTRTDLVNGLKTSDIDVPGRKRAWSRSVLVIAQVAASLMLLTTAYSMIRRFEHVWGEGMGFPNDHLMMVSLDPRLTRYDKIRTQQFYDELAKRARALPGVQGETLTENIPLGVNNWQSVQFVPDGFSMPRDLENFNATRDAVDEDYFSTLEIPILRGRGFLRTDGANAPRVAIVNEQFAKHYWPHQDPIGKIFRLKSRDGTPVQVVGEARTTKYQWVAEAPQDFVYLPMAQETVGRMTLMLRSHNDPEQLAGAVREMVHGLDPNQPLFELQTYNDYYQNRAVEAPKLIVEIVSGMGMIGLLLAVAGLYGLVAYNVNRRTREIGIRMAIGAARQDVLRLVLRQGFVLVGVGTAFGLVMGLGAERLLNSLFANPTTEFLAYAIVVPSLFAITMLAAYVPARRASRIEPTRALRYE